MVKQERQLTVGPKKYIPQILENIEGVAPNVATSQSTATGNEKDTAAL
jgi:hypothetical protein